jgi:hypothetical protein
MNIETGALFYDYAHSARFASISVLWALYAIGLMIVGVVKNIEILRKCSFGLFGLTILKVVLIDMSNVSTPFRIISFVVLGLMLMGSSYLYHRYRSRILGAESENFNCRTREKTDKRAIVHAGHLLYVFSCHSLCTRYLVKRSRES